MRLSIPVYVEQFHSGADDERNAGRHMVRPLFVPHYAEHADLLQRAMTSLTKQIKKKLLRHARGGDFQALLPWTFAPELEERFLKFRLDLKRRTGDCRHLVVAFHALGRKVAFSPRLPDLWFEVGRGESVRDRAENVFTEYYRRQERISPHLGGPEADSVSGRAFLLSLDLEVALPGPRSPEKTDLLRFALLGDHEEMHGDEELDRAGECLDLLYPDDLDRVVQREGLAEELQDLLGARDKRPVLLLGPRLSGKTALVHEYVFRQMEQRSGRVGLRRNVWLLSPQRLISGMSVVGQWENRLLVIMEEARRRDHVLYFDDLPGLYLAGISASSTLNVAQVLKPWVENREFRVLAEATPEAFRALKERDRGFADLFHVIRVEETAQAQTLRIMIQAMRRIEEQYRCCFGLDVLPTILELQGRYVHDAVFPGKAAAFARGLAVKLSGQRIARQDVLEEFSATSGLSLGFLDGRRNLTREEAETGIRAGVIGQDAAVQALVDAVCRAKARLNDPERPLGTFLFVGPTGVGKTQCAKAAAAYLYGNEDRLIRFDMNEFVDAASAVRLVGSLDAPEGLLTGELRRQPFCVLLLDEIEKAHPDVFDLLLQVLGEGRLTDALGRTADFRNALVILTSNLGARKAGSIMGYSQNEQQEQQVYLEAAQAFFRPEFMNRLDHVVPFAPLNQDEVSRIAHGLLREIMARHGLRQRRCALHVAPEAMERLITAGYQPRLGARALKRVMEQQLAQPIANRLAGFPPDAPTVITVYAARQGLAVVTQGLVEEQRQQTSKLLARSDEEILDQVDFFLVRVQHDIDEARPEEPMRSGAIMQKHRRHIALTEQMREVRGLRDQIVEHRSGRPLPASWSTLSRPAKSRVSPDRGCRWDGQGVVLRELAAAQRVAEVIRDMVEEGQLRDERSGDDLEELVMESSLLQTMLNDREQTRVLLCCLSTDVPGNEPGEAAAREDDPLLTDLLADMYELFFNDVWGMSCERVHPGLDSSAAGFSGWLVAGPGAAALAGREAGSHMLLHGEEVRVAIVRCVPLNPGDDPLHVLQDQAARRAAWLADLAHGRAGADDDPFPMGRVLRLFSSGAVVDFRTGKTGRFDRYIQTERAGRTSPSGEGRSSERTLLRSMFLDGLPMPLELHTQPFAP